MARRTSGELKRLSREFLMDHYTIPILAMLIAILLPEVLILVFTDNFTIGWNAATAVSVAASIIIQLIAQLFSVSIVRIQDRKSVV